MSESSYLFLSGAGYMEKQAISFMAFSVVLTRLLDLINQSQSQQD